jgi:hypothetical protein
LIPSTRLTKLLSLIKPTGLPDDCGDGGCQVSVLADADRVAKNIVTAM